MGKDRIVSELYKLRKIVGSLPNETLNIQLDANYNKQERKIINKFESQYSRLKIESNNKVENVRRLYNDQELLDLDMLLKFYNSSESKYIMFGIMLGILDHNIAFCKSQKDLEEFIEMRHNVSNHYQNLKTINKNNISVLDYAIMNYPSSKNFLCDYSKLSKEGFCFILNYTESYKNAERVDVHKIYDVFDSLLTKLYNIELENYKEYKKLKKKKY